MEKSESTAMLEGQKARAEETPTYWVPSTLSNLSKLLPTGVMFIFMSLSNLIASDKTCGNWNKFMVASFLGILAIAPFLMTLTDTFKDESTGKVQVRYGIVTKSGFKSITMSKNKPSNEDEFKLNKMDLFPFKFGSCGFFCFGSYGQKCDQLFGSLG
ncbi:hypothetical protein SUGI_0887450 [Cryptomeria japonica]|nr:hypothetical protein SUGI_0887450 [Cryptomeria japonica]